MFLHDITKRAYFKQKRQMYQKGAYNLNDQEFISTNLEEGGGVETCILCILNEKKSVICT